MSEVREPWAYALALGDDALILTQRCAEWITRAPELEEDVALANIGLDLLGQATRLLARAGELEGAGRTEDDLAYRREPGEFRNLILCELDNTDFAVSMARLLISSCYQLELYRRLSDSTDPVIAAVAAKAVKEVTYHVEHAERWTVRLGDGTEVSHRRMQQGLERVWPHLEEMFDDSWLDGGLLTSAVAVRPGDLRPDVMAHLGAVIAESTLTTPSVPPAFGRGRYGEHTAALTELLAELQQVARAHPGAAW